MQDSNSDDPGLKKTLDNPRNIVPQQANVAIRKPFDYPVPATSLVVIRGKSGK